MKGLTAKQRKIIDFIEDFTEKNSVPPSIYEIADFLGIKAPTASIHIKALVKKKIIQKTNKARSLIVSPAYAKFRTIPKPEFFAIPIIRSIKEFDFFLNSPDFRPDEYIFLEKNKLNIHGQSEKDFFAMIKKRDSLKKNGILRGDILILKKITSPPKPNSIVAAIVKDDILIRVYNPIENNKYIELLEAGENPRSMTFLPQNIKVIGSLVALFRTIPQ